MELRANHSDRVCSECGKVGDWVIVLHWNGIGFCLCQEHYDTLRGMLGGPVKLPEKPKPPRKVIY